MKKMNQTLFMALLLSGLACSVLGGNIQGELNKANTLAGERKYDEAIRLLADAASKPEVPFGQRKDAAFRVARFIHVADKSVYPLLREKLEVFLKIEGLTDMDKKFLLDSVAGSYSRVRDQGGSLKAYLRILELKELTDQARSDALEHVAQIYIHHFRELEKGRPYFHQSIELRRKMAAAIADPLARAAKLERIGWIYRTQTRESELAKKAYLEAVAVYTNELPKLSGIKKARTYVSLGGIYKDIRDKEKAEEFGELAVAEYIRILDASDKLPAGEWVKAVSPVDAMIVLRQTPEGARRAIAIADKMLSTRDDEAVGKELGTVLAYAVGIAGWGPDASLRPRTSFFIEQQVSLAKTPEQRYKLQLQLGESYFRRDHELEKARKVFAEVAAAADAKPDIHETAELWCEMLSDTGQ